MQPHVQRPKCNGRKNSECPIDGNCQVSNVVYKCDVTRSLTKKVYLGPAEGDWRTLFYNHKLSFKYKGYSNKTTLSSYIRHLKSINKWNLKLPVLRSVPPYSNTSKKCLLCLYRKREIVTYQNQKKLRGTIEQEIWTPL